MNNNNETKTTLLTTKTVVRRLHKLQLARDAEKSRFKEIMRQLDKETRLLQVRCPHDETIMHYGQYEPTRYVCVACGMELH